MGQRTYCDVCESDMKKGEKLLPFVEHTFRSTSEAPETVEINTVIYGDDDICIPCQLRMVEEGIEMNRQAYKSPTSSSTTETIMSTDDL